MNNRTAIEILNAVRATFRGDIADSKRSLGRKNCKDPTWHDMRVRVREEDIEALTMAISALTDEEEAL